MAGFQAWLQSVTDIIEREGGAMRFGYEVFHQDVATLVDFYVDVLGFAVPGDK